MTPDAELSRQGGFKRGHGIDCKYCGWPIKAHTADFDLPEFSELRDGYECSLHECVGYFPEDESVWLEAEEEYNEGYDFRRECNERDAVRRVGWNQYAAHVRLQNFEEMSAEEQEEALRKPMMLHIG